jgi:hypothetical protein
MFFIAAPEEESKIKMTEGTKAQRHKGTKL